MEFLKALLIVSEKAANIARRIREDELLFRLLVEKKDNDEANPRFVEDFKTLADVLIQEMVKHDIKEQFPGIGQRICGEESNEFRNQLGEKIKVEIKPNLEETSSLLSKVLNGDTETADILATEVHKTISLDEVNATLPVRDFDLNIERVGIWIDPIDATFEYINGVEKGCDKGIYLSGLNCVTILIGVFDQETGKSIIGVINRPFHKDTSSQRCIWGVALNCTTNLSPFVVANTKASTNVICLSSSESPAIKEKLKSAGYELVESCGAGYKMLTVILGLADAYILSKPTTYFWDTCAPQAILRMMGGDVIRYDEAMMDGSRVEVEYAFCTSRCNNGGIIAYSSEKILTDVMSALSRE
ncbi:inositol polyphosphate 1-phosphatase [Cylas formicarius]|uniref:inositol polyphosphate 1-phosphatase n=1 Tax=Cylas formicarius TaxID=197179 RepID=UPI002958797D|nr:inositol polyphosphate 1-phosphatase [Cylas formicarius]XP_060516682.1 inositol polyphosphate 1-phosphatase [Cylas formicarius]XP_060516683.1 inositol polyphosphate 1-phosphatase [Cylas formicarius]XP_060516684.1 inositol polyphosphate 1-phosphatase [Cylas formicarius]XP_060516686.1 inositol polyphosphate 1-phosphatase [Cylas formicarius]XP_060516687.1 inositol polyphosphate 1-phosphatase [Cylas formicarius]XP_060516688.1 inositol polyphosphate 1-phosphatase [Cylas formicarius]XP_06051668